MQSEKFEVPVDRLRWECDPAMFRFESTQELPLLGEFIGQERATKAVEFGLNMSKAGYNIYVAGVTGTGKASMVKAYIEKLIAETEARGEAFALDDWCYLYNFKEPDRPQTASFARGRGGVFRDQIARLLDGVRGELGRAFSSDEYKSQRQKTVEEGQSEQQKILQEAANEVRQQGFFLQMTPTGPILIPMTDNRAMEEEEYLALEEERRKELDTKRTQLFDQLRTAFEKAASVEQETTEELRKTDTAIGERTVSRLFAPLLTEHAGSAKVSQYLSDLNAYVLDNLDVFKAKEEPAPPIPGFPVSPVLGGRNPFLPFEVNVFVDNSENTAPPVIVESNPNFGNLFGKIERRFVLGGYLSDHTMLKAGALSRANGGYLLLNARDVLMYPVVWHALKRAIKNEEVRLEDPFEEFGLVAPPGMRPEPMPIHVKVVLLGGALLYEALSMYDEDFWEIFKVKAEFNFEIEKNERNMLDYAAFIAGCCQESGARHFDPTGVAKVIEYSSRIVADQERLSSRFAQIKEWIEEADYWASRDDAKSITALHVQKAVDERLFRHNLVEERIRDMINRGMIMIDVEGGVVGQVNGLSVYALGDITFGRPSRITASTFLGRGGVINIERESQLSGPIHDKGVMILSGYLGWKYAQDSPLSLSASVCFEQSYEGVEGDSASSSELYAILSSLSGVPVRQSIAVTGSVNQKGEIQPIGGVNQKIEGFFRVCEERGLSGEQGVLIPHRNLRNLMLRQEVVEAVRKGMFHIYAADTIDEGIEILTGVPAGERQADGTYPEGTVNFLVDQRLKAMAEGLKGYYTAEKAERASEGDTK